MPETPRILIAVGDPTAPQYESPQTLYLAPGVYHVVEGVHPPDTTPDVPTPPTIPAPRWPLGKTVFLWQVGQCEQGNGAAIVSKLLQGGFRSVFIKVNQEEWDYNNRPADKLQSLVTLIRSAGISVWGWGYIKLNKPQAEAEKAAERVRTLGLAGYVVNGEPEVKHKPSQTLDYCQALRALVEQPLGFCSYRYPLLHQEVAWRTWWEYMDFDMPQVYWLEARSVTAPPDQLAKSMAQFDKHRQTVGGKKLPYIPVGVSSPNDPNTWQPTVEQLNAFNSAAWIAKVPAVSWWSLQHMLNLNYIGNFDYKWFKAISAHGWS